jgi:O-antigen biosynthesis protein
MELRQNQATETLFLHEGQNSNVPSVTVIIPLYNYGQFLTEALDSVAMQTIGALDVIVVDDCSTDDSPVIASRWMARNCARFRRASVLRHLTNGGLAATRNTGFSQSQTEFVFPLDADNLLYPACLEKLSQSLNRAPAAFAYCIIERFATPPAELPPPFLMHIHPWCPEALPAGNRIDAMVLLRRSVWMEVGGYSLRMPCQGWEDYDLWFKIAKTGGYGLHLPQILARYRVHASSMLHTVTNKEKNIELLGAYLRGNYPEFFTEVETVKPGQQKSR